MPLVYSLINAVCAFLTVHLFVFYLTRYLKFPRLHAMIGGILFITMLSLTMTITFPMLEPISFLFVILAFMAAASKNMPLFIVASILGVATKEVLIIFSLLWLVNHVHFAKGRLAQNMMAVLVSSVPILAFCVIRVALGGIS